MAQSYREFMESDIDNVIDHDPTSSEAQKVLREIDSVRTTTIYDTMIFLRNSSL